MTTDGLTILPILFLAGIKQVHGIVIDPNVGLEGVGGAAGWGPFGMLLTHPLCPPKPNQLEQL